MDKKKINTLARGDMISMRGLLFFVLAPYRPLESVIECAYLKEDLWVHGDVTFALLSDPGFIHTGSVRDIIAIFFSNSPLLDVVKPTPLPESAKKFLGNKWKSKRKKRR